jgi:hypothetical protein
MNPGSKSPTLRRMCTSVNENTNKWLYCWDMKVLSGVMKKIDEVASISERNSILVDYEIA